jgi:hypothetical protein
LLGAPVNVFFRWERVCAFESRPIWLGCPILFGMQRNMKAKPYPYVTFIKHAIYRPQHASTEERNG